MTVGSSNPFPSILITEGTEPAAPAAGKQRLYIDSTTHHLMRVPSSGTEVDIEGGGSSDLDAIITASSGQDIADALSGAAAPDSGNVFATMADVGGGGGGLPWRTQIDVWAASSNTNWNTFTASTGEWLQSSGAQNDSLEFEGVSLEAGTYTAIARVFRSTNHGIISIQLDSVEIGTIDLYNGGADPQSLQTDTGMVVGSTDVYQLKLKMAAKNGSSSSYYGLIRSFVLVRTA